MASKNPKRAVEQVRDQIVELKDRRREIGNAPVSRDEAEAAIDRHLENMAEVYRNGRVLHGLTSRGALDSLSAHDHPEAFACFMFADVVKARLMREVELQLENGLSRGERAAEIAQIKKQLTEAERKEEQTIREAEEDGLDITRRPDADPRVVLDLDL